jgi:hypothetical protein
LQRISYSAEQLLGYQNGAEALKGEKYDHYEYTSFIKNINR